MKAEIVNGQISEQEAEILAMNNMEFRFNACGAWQRDLNNEWAIVIAPRIARGRTTWIAKLDHKSRIKEWATKFKSPLEAAEFSLTRWKRFT